MVDREYSKIAEQIMNLVDEYPSEPFSIDRKWLLEKIADKFANFVGLSEDEESGAYDVGYDAGYAEANDESDERIRELEERIEELEDQLQESEDEVNNSFAEGFEAGERIAGAESVQID